MGTKQGKAGPLKEPLAFTASASEVEQIPKEKKTQEENSEGNRQSRKGDFEEVP